MYRTFTFSADRTEPAESTVNDAEKAVVAPLITVAVDVTSYNPEVGQNDSTPCIGASGQDQCQLARTGTKILALSQDLRAKFLPKNGKSYQYPVQVYLESNNPSIQGCYWVYDTMNARWRNRVDLFFMDRSQNQGTKKGEKAHLSNKLEFCSLSTAGK